eukprot:gene17107-biopygen12243
MAVTVTADPSLAIPATATTNAACAIHPPIPALAITETAHSVQATVATTATQGTTSSRGRATSTIRKTRAQFQQHKVNDSWVDCHINVERQLSKASNTSSSTSTKRTTWHTLKSEKVTKKQMHDKIHQYLNSRYVGPHKAVYELQYNMYDKSHKIVRLANHLPDQHAICFTDPEQAAHRNNDSMLMTYFTLNQREHNDHSTYTKT